ncbi:MAG: hypothetical protein AAFX76_07545 [Planctomycetota bacterium]
MTFAQARRQSRAGQRSLFQAMDQGQRQRRDDLPPVLLHEASPVECSVRGNPRVRLRFTGGAALTVDSPVEPESVRQWVETEWGSSLSTTDDDIRRLVDLAEAERS